jgi:hypothetical protein
MAAVPPLKITVERPHLPAVSVNVTVLEPPGPFESLNGPRTPGTREFDSTVLADAAALKRFLAILVRGATTSVAASCYRPRLDSLFALLAELGAKVDADPMVVKLDG